MQKSHAGQRLVAEFADDFSREVVMDCFRDTAKRWADAPVQIYVELFAERFTRQRLLAVTQAS